MPTRPEVAAISLAELLAAIRPLSREDQKQLMELLSEEVNVATTGADQIPQHLRHLIPPPGTVIDVGWPVTIDAAGFEMVQKALNEMNRAR